MAKLTLLDMVQNILGAMESDKVSDISSTDESLSVAEVIKETYYDLIASRDWPFLRTYSTLTALGDSSNPTKMQFPDTVNKVFWLKYNKKDVSYLDPKEFRDTLDLRTELAGVVNSGGYILNADPQYWTTYDDTYVYFDGYNSSTDVTLQSSKSQAYMLIIPAWTLDNEFVPTLPEKMFPLILADAKSTCFLNFKQIAQSKEERKAQRLRVRMQNEAWRNDKGESVYNNNVHYGRNPTTTSRIRPRGT